MKKIKKIYHYSPLSPSMTSCNIRESSYSYSVKKEDVDCKDCLKIIKRIENETRDFERRSNDQNNFRGVK